MTIFGKKTYVCQHLLLSWTYELTIARSTSCKILNKHPRTSVFCPIKQYEVFSQNKLCFKFAPNSDIEEQRFISLAVFLVTLHSGSRPVLK